jgi:hypothetical protein
MILSAHQPQFMPWLGYFDKMAKCDLFVILDNVQFKRNEWQNRNKLLSSDGWQWLTVPVLHDFGQNIDEVPANNTVPWRKKHPRTIAQVYSRRPGFAEVMPLVEGMYAKPWDKLCAVNMHSIEMLRSLLGVGTKLEFSSRHKIEGMSTQRLVNLCKYFGADTYLSGPGGHDYMDMGLFEQAGIKVIFHEYTHPVYPQQGKEFIPYMAALDMAFQLGPAKAKELFAQGLCAN